MKIMNKYFSKGILFQRGCLTRQLLMLPNLHYEKGNEFRKHGDISA